jgi:hypothetical protein
VGANKCTAFASYFDGHADALEQYAQYLSMLYVKGYTTSLWTLPSGDYSLHIAQTAARVTGKNYNE